MHSVVIIISSAVQIGSDNPGWTASDSWSLFVVYFQAELEKLEQKQVEDGVSDSILPPSSPRSAPSQSQTSSAAMKVPAASALSPSEPESAVSSSVRTTPELTDTAPQPSKKSAVSSASSCVSGAGEGAESSGVAKSKRCAAESFRKEDRTEKQEPTVKKARLVAYDARKYEGFFLSQGCCWRALTVHLSLSLSVPMRLGRWPEIIKELSLCLSSTWIYFWGLCWLHKFLS